MGIMRIGDVHEVQAFTMKLHDGRYAGYIEHKINGGRQPEIESHQAGIFDTEAEAFEAALEMSRNWASTAGSQDVLLRS